LPPKKADQFDYEAVCSNVAQTKLDDPLPQSLVTHHQPWESFKVGRYLFGFLRSDTRTPAAVAKSIATPYSEINQVVTAFEANGVGPRDLISFRVVLLLLNFNIQDFLLPFFK
jgi:hypothetical protein